jgi:hypothetical protein
MLEITDYREEKKLRKSIVYYAYKRRLSTCKKSYLASESYLNSLLQYLPYSDSERMLIEQEIKYCHIFNKCDYEVPYPLAVSRQIPVLN